MGKETLSPGLTSLRSEIHQFLASFKPPETLTVAQWAEKYRWLEKGSTSKPGRYSFDSGPYQREPQESYTDRAVQTTVLQWASRTGKTETLNNLDGYIIDHDPKAILVVYPTLDSATKWRKEFFNPMVRATPRLRGKINIKARHQDNTMLSIKFPGGHIAAIGANSPSGFRQIQSPVVRCDEIDAMEDSKEGDPVALSFKRADNYPDSIQVLSSTPTIKGKSRIESWLERSDYRKWFCPCQQCGTLQVLEWSQVKWDTDATEGAKYVCENKECEHPHDDAGRRAMVEQGEWRPTKPFTGIRGYWLNGLNTLFPAKKGFANKMHQFVAEYLEAKDGGKATMRTWKNTFLAITDDPQEESEKAPDWQRLYNLRENYTAAPRAVSLVTCFVDIQNNRLELEWKGWARDEQSWGLDYLVLDGNPLDIQPGSVWHRLMSELQRKFKREDGAELELSMCFVDAGKWGDWAFQAYRLSQTYPKVMGKFMLSKGVGQQGAPINPRKMTSIHRNIKGIPIGAWAGKDLIYTRLRLDPNADGTFPTGYMHHPQSYDANYFQQLTSDSVVMEYKAGEEVRKYGNNEGKRDEALDCAYGNLAVFMLRRWNFDAMEADLAQTRPDAPAQAAPSAWFSGKAPGGWNL